MNAAPAGTRSVVQNSEDDVVAASRVDHLAKEASRHAAATMLRKHVDRGLAHVLIRL
jgi:hypothetical protein